MSPPERPLGLGEVLAETARVYGDRLWAAFGLGAFVAATLVAAFATGNVITFVILASLSFTASYAAAARLIAGDPFVEAWAQVALRLPVLLALTVVVSVPFILGRIDLLLLVFGVAWLAFAGFAVPVTMLEGDREERWFGRLGYALSRSLELAKTEYLHAFGVAAALVLVYVLLGAVLGSALTGFGENSEFAANVLVQVVLAPFFFLGLAVLYFDQRARVAERG